jgi:hypothetical protein
MWWNKKKKLNYQRLRQFRIGDEITYQNGSSTYKHKIVNNDPETESLSIMIPYYSYTNIKVFKYSNEGFNDIRALNPDPQDDTDLKTFLNDIINNVGQPITDLQKDQANDLIKSYKL